MTRLATLLGIEPLLICSACLFFFISSLVCSCSFSGGEAFNAFVRQ